MSAREEGKLVFCTAFGALAAYFSVQAYRFLSKRSRPRQHESEFMQTEWSELDGDELKIAFLKAVIFS